MTVKEYLSQAFEIEKNIKSKIRQIQKLKDMQMDVVSKLTQDKVQTTIDHDRKSKISDDIMDLEQSFNDDIVFLINAKNKIKRVINEVQNYTYQLVLEERYVNFKEWKDVASDNNYSERRVYELHGEALQELTNLILQRYFDAV